jgi:cobalt-zinc-cadmium efflux system membrane fusion protein
MNENPDLPRETESDLKRSRGNRKVAIVAIVAAVVVVAIVFAAWFFRSGSSGKPVPAPRSISFAETPSQPTTSRDQKLTLSAEQLQRAGLKIEAVGERPSTEAASQMATGIVQANTYKETPVISLVGGIVRSVNGELGRNVSRGQPVAVVFSHELAEAQSNYLKAIAELDEHHRHHTRAMKLVEIGAASREELEMANTKLRDAESNVANLRQKLLLLGLSSQRVSSLNSASQVSSEVSVPAPSSGTVTSRTVNPGEVIEANKELMRVTDLSSVWVVGQVYEKDLAMIHVGSGANITSETYPNRTFRGQVSYIDPKIDQPTRTAQVRIELANPGQMFKIGMYVNVGFATLGGAEKTVPAVPKDAVQTIGNQQFVFVATDKPNEFILRPVRLGQEVSGSYQVIEGINVSDRIVTQGSFLLRAEWYKTHPTGP